MVVAESDPSPEGNPTTLANEKLVSVSIELIETDEAQVSAVTRVMKEAGLQFVHKKQNAAFATAETTDVKNFLFHRDPAKYQRLMDERIAKIVADHTAKYENHDEHEGLFTVDQMVDQIVGRIAGAPIDSEPSPNLYMENMLPDPVYQELLARLPGDAALDPIDHPDAIAPDGRRTRYLLDLTHDSLARINPDDQPFWQAMIEVFTAPAIAEAIIAKFAPSLHERFGSDLPELVAVPLLYRDLPGYRIGIHPDTPSKIATLQFYLPADDSQRHLGTSFHKRTDAGFQQLKTNDFRPNAGYAFVRTDESWHSVHELAADETPRNSIALTFYIKGQAYKSAPVAPAEAAAPSFIVNDVYDAPMGEALRLLAKSFSRRDDVASLFLEGGAGVELGVAAGDFSERILNRSKIGYLYSVDMWEGDRGHGIQQYREAIARLSPYRDRNTILRMRFDDALPLFSDHALDFIYVDGYAHDGELDGATFRDWYPKLKSGGIIAGDDYHADWPLVVSSVDAFVAEYQLELHVIQCGEAETWNSKYPTWFAMKP